MSAISKDKNKTNNGSIFDQKSLVELAVIIESGDLAPLAGPEKKNDVATMERLALIESIVQILKTTIDKVELALILPQLLIEKDDLLKFMSNTHRQRIMKCLSKYLDEREESQVENVKMEEISVDHQLERVIDLLYKNQKLKEEVPNLLNNLPAFGKKFLDTIKTFVGIAENRLRTTSSMEMNREKILHRIWHDNEKTKKKISDLKSKLHEKEIAVQWKISEKHALIKKYKQSLSDKKWMNNILIKKEVVSANKRMTDIYNESEERQAKLKEEADRVKDSYAALLAENMKIDKGLRTEKSRVLEDLKGWIKKYDTDIGEHTKELEKLTEQLEIKNAELDEFMIEFDRQEKEYHEVIAMKENEEKLAVQERMLIFMMNRAARIIQNCWRKYIQRKKKKSKGKGKGKKPKK